MNKALFLDRDGVLNEVVIRNGVVGSPRCVDELEIIDSAREVIRTAKDLGYMSIVVTNQPDVGRNKMDSAELEKMHDAIERVFPVDLIQTCMSCEDSDFRRKPNPGMLLEAAEKFNIDLKQSLFLGDGEKDVIAGRRAGVETILLQTYYNVPVHGTADRNVNSFMEVIDHLQAGAKGAAGVF